MRITGWCTHIGYIEIIITQIAIGSFSNEVQLTVIFFNANHSIAGSVLLNEPLSVAIGVYTSPLLGTVNFIMQISRQKLKFTPADEKKNRPQPPKVGVF